MFSAAKAILLFAMTAVVFNSCSTHVNVAPTPPTSKAQLLTAGEWFTVGATLIKADSTTLVLSGTDPFLKTILLYNVTFYVDGTATDTNDPNGLTKNGLTWQLAGSHLLVHVNDNNTDRVDAMITYLNESKMVLNVTDFYYYNGVTYVGLIQTFGH